MRSLLHDVTEQPRMEGEFVKLILVAYDRGTMMVRDVYKNVDIAQRCTKIAEDGGPQFTHYFYFDDLKKAVIPDNNKEE